MSSHVLSTRGVVHKVVSDDGHRMVLQNPSGSTITVTKSRHKFTPVALVPTIVHGYRLVGDGATGVSSVAGTDTVH